MTDDDQISISEALSSEYQTVFQDKSLIEPDTIVDEDRIVGRDNQLKKVINILKPALHGDQPEDMLLRGPSGTGKSLIAGTVTEKAIAIGDKQGVDMKSVEVNGKHKTSEFEAIHDIVRQFEKKLDLEQTPKTGVSTSSKYDRLYNIVDEYLDIGIIVLDELDLLDGDHRDKSEAPAYSDILYKLSRSTRIGNMQSDISVIVTTNSPKSLMEGLNSRTSSTFNPTEISFSDYDANEIREILRHRRDAFKSDTLDDDVIPYTAALSAQGEGDARFAIDLLREAGNIADRLGDTMVTEDHVDKAVGEVEKNYIVDVVENVSVQKQVSLFAAAIVNKYGKDILERKTKLSSDSAPAPVAYSVYNFICDHTDMSNYSRHSFLRWMRELQTYEVIEINRQGRGNESGVFVEYRFYSTPAEALVETMVDQDERFQETLEDEELVRSVVKQQLKDF